MKDVSKSSQAHSAAARRILAAAAVTCAAALVPAAALASAGQHAGQARTATPSCATSGLDVWLNTNGTGATGHVIYQLNFTNLSESTCTLFGLLKERPDLPRRRPRGLQVEADDPAGNSCRSGTRTGR